MFSSIVRTATTIASIEPPTTHRAWPRRPSAPFRKSVFRPATHQVSPAFGLREAPTAALQYILSNSFAEIWRRLVGLFDDTWTWGETRFGEPWAWGLTRNALSEGTVWILSMMIITGKMAISHYFYSEITQKRAPLPAATYPQST